MYLSEEQVARYDETGSLLLPGIFSEKEVVVLRETVKALLEEPGEHRVLEKNGDAVRSIHGSHLTDEICRKLTRHPALAESARQILGDDVYVYQFKINVKAALLGDVWDWHQDYIFWRMEDGLPRPDAINAAVFVDEVTTINGPLFLLQGSHREGMLTTVPDDGVPEGYEGEPDWISNLTADLKYALDKPRLTDLITRYPPAVPVGPAGSLLFFHPNVVHSSAQNMSPFDRTMILVSYSRIDNQPRTTGERRPEFLVSRDFRPIEVASADVLTA